MTGALAACGGPMETDASLRFHLVHDSPALDQVADPSLLNDAPGTTLHVKEGTAPLRIYDEPFMDETCLQSVSAGANTLAENYEIPVLNFKLTRDCKKIFADVTSENVGKRFAITIDGNLVTAPLINAPITGGSGYIEGDFSKDEVKALAEKFNR